ncbi:hypothetical protein CXF72_05355 [Psychromonas sp. MB-3u-54]|nr:hypothetical protein CXF72_05355 [Psychromonas sp. MB-3u-54]
MRFPRLQYKPETRASWSLLLVAIVLFVCVSQNLGKSSSCPLTPHLALTEQLASDTQDNSESECSSSEHLINTFALNLEFFIPLFVLALVIATVILQHSRTPHLFTEPISYYGVRRHVVFCTFQE